MFDKTNNNNNRKNAVPWLDLRGIQEHQASSLSAFLVSSKKNNINDGVFPVPQREPESFLNANRLQVV